MRLLGDLILAGAGFLRNARVDNVTADPENPTAGQIWYNTTDGVYRGFDGTAVVTFASGGNTATIQTELDATQTGAGLATDGSYVAANGANYISTATSLADADTKLDTQLKTLADSLAAIDTATIQTELDATQAGAGLATDGSYVADEEANYISTATSLADADTKLDAKLKIASDAAAAAQTTANAALPVAGGAMSGNIAMGGTNKITGLAAGTNATDAVTLGQMQAAMAGLDFQPDVLDVQTDNTLVPTTNTGDRYIITNSAALNGAFGTIAGLGDGDIVEYDGTEFVVVYDVSAAGPGAMAWNRAGGTFWYYNTSWSQFGGLDGVTAGVGLDKTGNVMSVKLGAGIGQLPTNEVGVDLRTAGGLFLTTDGESSSTDTAAKLGIQLDGSSLGLSANGLSVADGGITSAKIAAAALGNGLTGGAGTALSVLVVENGGLSLSETGLSVDTAVLDTTYARKDGVTYTGPVVLAADPTNALGAATKQYVDVVAAAASNGTFVYTSEAAAVSHTVEHHIGSKYCNVTVVDSADSAIIPDSITFTNANSLVVTFASAITCKVVVTGKYVPAP